jgi:hypothetical protein
MRDAELTVERLFGVQLALEALESETTAEQDNREEDTQKRQHCQRL